MPYPHQVLGATVLDYEAWRDLLRSICGRNYSEGAEPNAFAGWVRPVTAGAFTALELGATLIRSSGPIEIFAKASRSAWVHLI
jgi:hypothetical protein